MSKKATRAKYMLVFRLEAEHMAEGSGIAELAHRCGVPAQVLLNWVKVAREIRLLPLAGTGRAVSTEQMELGRLRAELSCV